MVAGSQRSRRLPGLDTARAGPLPHLKVAAHAVVLITTGATHEAGRLLLVAGWVVEARWLPAFLAAGPLWLVTGARIACCMMAAVPHVRVVESEPRRGHNMLREHCDGRKKGYGSAAARLYGPSAVQLGSLEVTPRVWRAGRRSPAYMKAFGEPGQSLVTEICICKGRAKTQVAGAWRASCACYHAVLYDVIAAPGRGSLMSGYAAHPLHPCGVGLACAGHKARSRSTRRRRLPNEACAAHTVIGSSNSRGRGVLII